jgi:hypothetical protein
VLAGSLDGTAFELLITDTAVLEAAHRFPTPGSAIEAMLKIGAYASLATATGFDAQAVRREIDRAVGDATGAVDALREHVVESVSEQGPFIVALGKATEELGVVLRETLEKQVDPEDPTSFLTKLRVVVKQVDELLAGTRRTIAEDLARTSKEQSDNVGVSGSVFDCVGRIGAQRVPGRTVVVERETRCAVGVDQEPLHVVIHTRIEGDVVVHVVSGLLPGIETYLLPGVVGVQGGDDALDGVVEQHRADADADVELETLGIGEERFVLADGLALVVEDGPAAPHPARADVVRRHRLQAVRAQDDLPLGIALGNRSRLSLNLLLDLTAKAVGVGEADLDSRAARGQRVVEVGLASQRGGAGRLPMPRIVGVGFAGALEAVQVVEESGSWRP